MFSASSGMELEASPSGSEPCVAWDGTQGSYQLGAVSAKQASESCLHWALAAEAGARTSLCQRSALFINMGSRLSQRMLERLNEMSANALKLCTLSTHAFWDCI